MENFVDKNSVISKSISEMIDIFTVHDLKIK